MKSFLPLCLIALAATSALAQVPAEKYTRTIFSDDFASGFAKGWGHWKSISVAKDAAFVGITPEGSDHPAVDFINLDGERDLEVTVKFRFLGDKGKNFDIWLDDRKYAGSHAGHVCKVTTSLTGISIMDAKTGWFRSDLVAKRKTPEGLSAEDQAYLKTKQVNFPVKYTLNEWHTLVVRSYNDVVEVLVDGAPVGSFKSEGFTHETKALVSLTTNLADVEYDDFSVKGVAKP